MAEEKKRILELVESGKLTVDEALKLMEKVDEVNEKKSLNEEEKIILEDFQKESKFHEKKKETSSNYGFNFQAAKDKPFDIVDTTIKKVKEVDLDLNFG
ncbi:SHOCT-like domain-containing protein, partial [Streptococcus hyovaginalis]